MFFRKTKNIIYILLFVFILSFILPLYSYAIDENNIYMWSNYTESSINTSATPDTEKKDNTISTENNSR